MGELGEFGRMGLVPRLASEILDRIAAKAATSEKLAKCPMFLTVSQYALSGGSVLDLLTAPSKGGKRKDAGVRGGESPVQVASSLYMYFMCNTQISSRFTCHSPPLPLLLPHALSILSGTTR